jgi:hypothetical protein
MSRYVKSKLEGLKWSLFELYVRLAVVWVVLALGFNIFVLVSGLL